MTITAIWLIAAGAALLSMGFIMLRTQRPDTGANIGAGGCFFFGLGATGVGLLLGAVAALAWWRGRNGDRHPPVRLLAWERRLRRLTMAAVGLITIGAIVLSVGALIFANGRAGSFFSGVNAIFLVGLCIAVSALLAATPPGVYWLSRRRSGADH
ncbi:hypothetical protein [Amycolatopsis minnesotensis]|uniref:hypothetical protein n=1 Tax=Amycolatopsis minnesotensis TaxID=337894 RepID=UPI0031D7782F